MSANTVKKPSTAKQKNAVKKRRVSTKHIWLMAGLILIAIGMVIGGSDLITNWWDGRNATTRAEAIANNEPISTPIPKISGTPIHIALPSVKIDLNVLPGIYDSTNKSWTLSLNSAHWAEITAKPNNKQGLTFIYAHNRPGVFMTLSKIKPGAEATVKTGNGHTFTYRFIKSIVTKPEDTSLFDYKGKPILALQTCTGIWYQNRQLYYFKLVNYE